MLPLLIITILFGLAMIGGFSWVLLQHGQVSHRSGEQLGAELMANDTIGDADGAAGMQHTVFRGKARAIRSEASIGFGEIKDLIAVGDWLAALPFLLAIGGMLGLLLFGAVTILAASQGFLGVLLTAVAAYAIIRTLISFARS